MGESPYSLQVTEKQHHCLEQRRQLVRNESDAYLPNVPAKCYRAIFTKRKHVSNCVSKDIQKDRLCIFATRKRILVCPSDPS